MKKYCFLVGRQWLFLVIAVLVFSACAKEDTAEGPAPARPVKSIVLQENSQARHRSFPGKIQPIQQVDLSFRVSGPLIEFPVDEGQAVKSGQVLARLDPRDFETAVANIKSSLAGAQAQLQAMESGARPEDIKMLEAEVEAARANLRATDLEMGRASDLYQERASTKAELDRARRARDVAKAQYDTAAQNLEKGKKGARQEDVDAQKSKVSGLTAQLAQIQAQLDDTNLKAPFDGLVAKKYVRNYQDIQAKQPILSLHDLSFVEIVVSVPEALIMMATKDEKINMIAVFDSLPDRKFKLTFKEIATQPDPQTNTYPVTLKMPAPPDINLLPGMTAQVTISWSDASQKTTNIFKAPIQAVFSGESGKSYVWVINPEDMTVHKAAVSVGELTGDSILILDGVKQGDRVVTAGVNFLTEGQKVRLLEPGQNQ